MEDPVPQIQCRLLSTVALAQIVLALKRNVSRVSALVESAGGKFIPGGLHVLLSQSAHKRQVRPSQEAMPSYSSNTQAEDRQEDFRDKYHRPVRIYC
jgi:hypothetical protein